ncbi:Protein-cysteine N-palmitoyltransferase porcupine [Trichinella nelsoni]|uniref:Protein-cysteine N-palmitoyltransferase porcupine n=1 Tax=Trichinella nelsoni TaxID=6336 RepID=A0A0V0S094_9BILA|nr:Protein-cysteine N-palmitoyltransferase porcupine [Trichinella nelsoni]
MPNEDVVMYDEDVSWFLYDQYDYVSASFEANTVVDSTVFDIYYFCIAEILFGDTGRKIIQLYMLCLLRNGICCLGFLPDEVILLSSSLLGVIAVFLWHSNLQRYNWLFLDARLHLVLSTIFSTADVHQFILLTAEEFNKLSGTLMIIAMKQISLSFAFGVSKWTAACHEPLAFFSYMTDVGTVVCGPWLSFERHCEMMKKKNCLFAQQYPMGCGQWRIWVSIFDLFILLKLVAFSQSSENDQQVWQNAFRDAQSFRTSHYFICFVSQTCALLAGFEWHHETNPLHLVVEPLQCEWPRSLVNLVVSWNRPFHSFLKTPVNLMFYNVFQRIKLHGHFVAVFGTFCISALLHGYNFQLSAVLLSLGFYSYSEYILREKLARLFQACIRARSCYCNCTHKRKWFHPLTMLVNLIFTLLGLFHLTYLGMVYDSGSAEEQGYNALHTIKKEENNNNNNNNNGNELESSIATKMCRISCAVVFSHWRRVSQPEVRLFPFPWTNKIRSDAEAVSSSSSVRAQLSAPGLVYYF